VGLPNTGKSLVFNGLTGGYSVVANYPLTTVEMKRHTLTLRGQACQIIDTPGLHSLYIHSEEELAVRDLLFSETPDGLILCIDANRLKQSLLLTLDLLELDIPLVISLNAIDETEQQGLKIDARRLSALLGVPVVEHAAPLNRGIEELKEALGRMSGGSWKPYYGPYLEKRLGALQALLPEGERFRRKKALLLLEGDPFLAGALEGRLGADTGRRVREELARLRREYRGNPGREVARRRIEAVERIYREATARAPRPPGRLAHQLARLSRHPVFGIPILLAILALTWLLVVHGAGFLQTRLTRWLVDPAVRAVARWTPDGFWEELLVGHYGLLTLGLFNALVTVLPILAAFFLFMGFLEDTGYLPNLSVLTRRVLGRIGLSGRSIMSLILGFGCKTMAALTTRGISSRKERLIANYLIAFAIPCSAQLALDMAILGRIGLAAFLIAFGTLAFVEIAAGWILNRLIREEVKSDFIQELPPLRVPQPAAVVQKTSYRLYWFLKEALPIFLAASAALFLLEASGALGLLRHLLRPLIIGWLGLPLSMVEVFILTLARHEAAAGLLLAMVDGGALSTIQAIVAVAITTMFVPCLANIVAMCRQLGARTGLWITLAINVSSFALAGILGWILRLLAVGG
jgi:ferrous iron transport protein B